MDTIPIPDKLELTEKDIMEGSFEANVKFAINVGDDGAPASLTLVEIDGVVTGSDSSQASPGGIPSEAETMEQFVQKGVEKFNSKK